jgi:arabinofuranosyltransferase
MTPHRWMHTRSRLERLSLALAALPPLALLIAGYQRRWVTEDAFISLRVVRHILAGHGPVFNVDERVEAYTHPLWVAILSIWGLFGLPLEYGAVILGISFSLIGLVAAQAAAFHLIRATPAGGEPAQRLIVPFGAVVFVAVPVVWDFVTSGLESGLIFGWLGVSYLLLVRVGLRRPEQRTRRVLLTTAVVLGLGPLVRPDLAVFSAGLLLALAVMQLGLPRRQALFSMLSLAVAAGALPVAYQIFRMGYFAALVPNTALAKEAGEANWAQGRIYLADFVGTYELWIPLVPVMVWLGVLLARAVARHERTMALLLATPVVLALVHALWVMRVGGDFMHGRFLLPALFGLLLPVMLVEMPLPRARMRVAYLAPVAMAVVVVWAGVATTLRVPYLERIADNGLADERSIYADNSGHPHPVTLDDYMNMRQPWPRNGRAWRERADEYARVLIADLDEYALREGIDARVGAAALEWNVGLAGYAAGVETTIVDRYALSSAIGSRQRVEERGRPGHEKSVDAAWGIAQYTDATPQETPYTNAEAVEAARAALGCGELSELMDAIREPLDAERFLDNIRLSWTQRDFRIAPNPVTARAELCGA